MLYSCRARSMDQSGRGTCIGALCHNGRNDHKMGTLEIGDLARVKDEALPPALFRRARAAVARLGAERLRASYFTTFWLPRGATPAHPVEESVAALWAVAAPGLRCAGAEWWIGRSDTTAVPIGFHFDQDVKARRGLRHPMLSSVLFFNRVRGGHLAITDQRPGARGE